MTPWPHRRMGGPGSQSGSQSTAHRGQAKSARTPEWAGWAALRKHWFTIAAGVFGSVVLVVALAVGGGSGAGAQPARAGDPESRQDSASNAESPSPGTPAPAERASAVVRPARELIKKVAKQQAEVKIPERGPGTFVRAKIDGPKTGERGARLLRYEVKVEKNLPYDADETALLIQQILSDQRSWVGGGDWRLQLVSDPAEADFTIYLATPGTVDRYCWPLRTYGRVSCQTGSRVMLNGWRWAHGAKAYGKDVSSYRQYLVNHEVGHRLGHGHVGCPGKGKLAPVMMQQTKSVGTCRANPWPDPKRQS
ncbi:MAG: DUF3152 domain-containing protein [Microlunatus sp.]